MRWVALSGSGDGNCTLRSREAAAAKIRRVRGKECRVLRDVVHDE